MNAPAQPPSKERCKHLQQPPFGDGCHFTVLAGPMICPWCEIERLQRELEVRDLAVKTAAHGLGELFRENNALRASHEPRPTASQERIIAELDAAIAACKKTLGGRIGMSTAQFEALRSFIAAQPSHEPLQDDPARWKAAIQGHLGEDELWEVVREMRVEIAQLRAGQTPPEDLLKLIAEYAESVKGWERHHGAWETERLEAAHKALLAAYSAQPPGAWHPVIPSKPTEADGEVVLVFTGDAYSVEYPDDVNGAEHIAWQRISPYTRPTKAGE